MKTIMVGIESFFYIQRMKYKSVYFLFILLTLSYGFTFGTTLIDEGQLPLTPKDDLKRSLVLQDSLRDFSTNPNRVELQSQCIVAYELGRLLIDQGDYLRVAGIRSWYETRKRLFSDEFEVECLVKILNNIGIANRRSFQYTEALTSFLEALEWLNKLKKPNQLLLGSILNNAGLVLIQLADYNRAIDYLLESLRSQNSQFESNEDISTIELSNRIKGEALNNLAIANQMLGKHDLSIEYLNELLECKLLKQSDGIYRAKLNLAISLLEYGSGIGSKSILNDLLEDNVLITTNFRVWVQALFNLAHYYIKHENNFDYFEHYIGETITLLESRTYILKDIYLNSILFKSLIYTENKKYDEAHLMISEAMRRLFKDDWEASLIKLDLSTINPNEMTMLLNLLMFKAEVYFQWGREEQDSKLYDLAFDQYLKVTALANRWMTGMAGMAGRLEVSQVQRRSYNRLVDLGYHLFELSGDSVYLGHLFSFFEQGKAAGLWNEVRGSEMIGSSLPEAVVKADREIRQSVSYYMGLLQELKLAQDPNVKTINEVQGALFTATLNLDTLREHLRVHHPEYYTSRYDHSTLGMREVQAKLEEGQALLSYYFSDSSLYTMALTRSNIRCVKTALTDTLQSSLQFLVDFVRGGSKNFSTAAITRYLSEGELMHRTLLAGPLQEWCRHVIVIPDQILGLLPFEILLSEPGDTTRPDFRTQRYCFMDHLITYGYTATLYFHESKKKTRGSRKTLAMAPAYSYDSGVVSGLMARRRASLPDLPGAREEVRLISGMTGGRAVAGKEATEEMFKSLAGNYRVLHLAMHTLMDETDPQHSGLVFSGDQEGGDDGLLYAHELYNLDLNAVLTVLSACDTGTGKLAPGEGVLSIARGFVYAGCKNLIMTLWKIDDDAGKAIMERFYRKLVRGKTIAESLQESKLEYLGEANSYFSHPHFWAAFIHLGKDHPVPLGRSHWIWLGAIAIASGIVVLLIVRRRKHPKF